MQAATANCSTAFCPDMQCRTEWDSFLVACANVPYTKSALNTARQQLEIFDQVGKL